MCALVVVGGGGGGVAERFMKHTECSLVLVLGALQMRMVLRHRVERYAADITGVAALET